MRKTKSPHAGQSNRGLQEKKRSVSILIPLPLEIVNGADLGRAAQRMDDLIDQVAATGWQWNLEVSLCVDAVQVRLDRATEGIERGRFVQ
ncbi:hypothetical protein [Desulfovibrio oxyclinae]|uniref:hypothetical protein n=1 Tax=Desulfovibrio oxyclinae TaxID=63560 RepID=UPI00058FD07C|nr:hypothetical protein [Desulfovibrio oxyclinae]